MNTKQLLKKSKEIWGDEHLSFDEVIILLGVIYGDICRLNRDGVKTNELKKELGNLIFSIIKFCEELEFDHEECIQLAIECQKKFVKRKLH